MTERYTVSLMNNNGVTTRTRVRKPRTLGLPATAERALMAKSYETYVTACRVHVAAHNLYMRELRKNGHSNAHAAFHRGESRDFAGLKNGQLTKAFNRACKAAMLREDAKAQYRIARLAAERAAGRAAR